ncbi:hypothetical protein [Pyrococcus horikoshii]|uniref:hypothetical protein n=1 Tax=Pyrococcus horikoshii TaxID=53953 RepID=UPI0013053CE2|nr:hypothetical protein [Pyrococcus horikoshii]
MGVDYIDGSAVALVGLLIPEFFQRKVTPPERLQLFLKPLYNGDSGNLSCILLL